MASNLVRRGRLSVCLDKQGPRDLLIAIPSWSRGRVPEAALAAGAALAEPHGQAMLPNARSTVACDTRVVAATRATSRAPRMSADKAGRAWPGPRGARRRTHTLDWIWLPATGAALALIS